VLNDPAVVIEAENINTCPIAVARPFLVTMQYNEVSLRDGALKQDLAAQSVLTRSGISRVVERLERAGLVTREGASEDGRGAYAVLTEAGVARFRTALRAHVVFVRRHFLGFFSERELEQMAAFWRRVEERQGGATASEVESGTTL